MSAWWIRLGRWLVRTVVRPHQSVQGGDDGGLGVGFDAAGGLVQQQDVGVGQERAGDADALFLAAGEADAALADLGVVAVGAWRMMKPWALAALAAAMTCSIVASGWP